MRGRPLVVCLVVSALLTLFGTGIKVLDVSSTVGTRASIQRNSNIPSRCFMNPVYPMGGGAGCKKDCPNDEKKYISKALVYRGNVFPEDVVNGFKTAAEVVNSSKHGQPRSINIRKLHISLVYMCCYTLEEMHAIDRALLEIVDNIQQQKVAFSHAECYSDGLMNRKEAWAPFDHISLVTVVDDASERRLNILCDKIESALEARKLEVHQSRRRDPAQAFHMTIGVVNQSSFNVKSAMAGIDGSVRSWGSSFVLDPKRICRTEEEMKDWRGPFRCLY